MKKKLFACTMFFLILSQVFCTGQQENKKQIISMSAAASLTDCINELAKIFTQYNEKVSIQANYGASGALQQQIEHGAPADIFFSAGKKQMDSLVAKNIIDKADVKPLIENKIVLIVPTSKKNPISFSNLIDDTIQSIAVGDFKSVPVGQYTEQVFNYLKINSKITEKLIFAKDVREVLSWVETGNVDAGIVYETDAKITNNVTITAYAPNNSHNPVIYPVGIIKTSKKKEFAQEFITFMTSSEGKAVFKKYGFSVLE